MRIKEIKARKIFNSNGGDAIEIEVVSDVAKGTASIGSGTSVGKYEVASYPENIKNVISLVNNYFNKDLKDIRVEAFGDLKRVEDYARSHDVSDNMQKIGGNVVIALELAILKSASQEPLYKFLNKGKIKKMPIPLGNCIGGGKHIGGPDFQEFLVLPKTSKIDLAAEINTEVYKKVKDELKKKDKSFIGARNIEGAWVCNLGNIDALSLLKRVADDVGREYKVKIGVGLDIAGNSLWNGRRYEYKKFSLMHPKNNLSSEEQLDFVGKIIKNNELVYVEDPFYEDDFESFKELNKELCLICGDDLIASNPARLRNREKNISAVIVKPNQIGSLLKTKELIDIAKDGKVTPVMSHRSQETTDNSIAHLAVAWGCPIIKTGIVGGERISKINELLRINENL